MGNLIASYIVDIGAINTVTVLLLVIMLPVPHMLVFLWILYKTLHRVGCLHITCKGKECDDSNEDLLPDRLENSANYRELV